MGCLESIFFRAAIPEASMLKSKKSSNGVSLIQANLEAELHITTFIESLISLKTQPSPTEFQGCVQFLTQRIAELRVLHTKSEFCSKFRIGIIEISKDEKNYPMKVEIAGSHSGVVRDAEGVPVDLEQDLIKVDKCDKLRITGADGACMTVELMEFELGFIGKVWLKLGLKQIREIEIYAQFLEKNALAKRITRLQLQKHQLECISKKDPSPETWEGYFSEGLSHRSSFFSDVGMLRRDEL